MNKNLFMFTHQFKSKHTNGEWKGVFSGSKLLTDSEATEYAKGILDRERNDKTFSGLIATSPATHRVRVRKITQYTESFID
jgi:hypothetical protein